MVTDPKDTPFGLAPNVAAGLAYLFSVFGGIAMLVGGGTNQFVRWAAAQSITMFIVFYALRILTGFLFSALHLYAIWWGVNSLMSLLCLALYIWTVVYAFQGKEVRVPVIADVTSTLFRGIFAGK